MNQHSFHRNLLKEVLCMNSIAPETVAGELLLLLDRSPIPVLQMLTNVQ
jgi:hypothetical protein